VNRRLANDQITEQDPQHPKVLFPTQKQCPKCYISLAKNINDLAEHESPWNINEVLLFLTSFYSKYQIEGVDELDGKNAVIAAASVGNEKQQQQIQEGSKSQPPSVIDRPDNVNNVEAPSKASSPKQKADKHIERYEIEQPQEASSSSSSLSAQKSSDYRLMFFLFLLALATFAFMYVYFNYIKRKGKLKKHII
jgi:hypothetical protein